MYGKNYTIIIVIKFSHNEFSIQKGRVLEVPQKIESPADIVGNRFNKWTVVRYDGWYSKGKVNNKRHYYRCICECGEIRIVQRASLLKGSSNDCGCGRRKKNSINNKTHGLRHTRLYSIYADMKKRCFNPNSYAYSYYGGRGITVSQDWLGDSGFMSFYNWSISNGYEDNLTLDRENTNGNYSPDNCRWVNRQIQAENTRQSVPIRAVNKETNEEYDFPTISSCRRFTGVDPKTMKRSVEGKSIRGLWEFYRIPE